MASRTLACILFLLLASLAEEGCHADAPKKQAHCDSCIALQEVIPPVAGIARLSYSRPTAIGFFNWVNHFNRKQHKPEERDITNQERYRLLEQWGMYTDMKPMLIRNDITVIDTAFSDTLVTFESGAEHYTIDLRPYRVRDGVVLFQPGKKPVFWSDRSLGYCCDIEESFWSYFDRRQK